MLINCPKCGFSQPQDKYCANCGVDMEHYRPQAPSVWKKFFSNPFLHVTIVLILVFLSIWYVQQNRREEIRHRIAFLKSGPVIVEHEAKPRLTITRDSSRKVLATEPSTAPPATTASTSTTTTLVRAGMSGEKSSPLQVSGVNFYFLEVDSAVMASWLQESRINGQYHRTFDNVSMGPLPEVAKKLKAERVRVLEKITRPLYAASPIAEFMSGTHHSLDLDSELGLLGSVTVTEIKDGLIRGEINVRRSFRDPKEPSRPLEQTSFGFPYEIQATEGYMVMGIIPRRAYEFPDELNPDPYLAIYKSRPFLSGQTDFALLIQFDTH
jgi:hypothetical protein